MSWIEFALKRRFTKPLWTNLQTQRIKWTLINTVLYVNKSSQFERFLLPQWAKTGDCSRCQWNERNTCNCKDFFSPLCFFVNVSAKLQIASNFKALHQCKYWMLRRRNSLVKLHNFSSFSRTRRSWSVLNQERDQRTFLNSWLRSLKGFHALTCHNSIIDLKTTLAIPVGAFTPRFSWTPRRVLSHRNLDQGEKLWSRNSI